MIEYQILNLLSHSPQGLLLGEIYEGVIAPHPSVRDVLLSLLEEGKVSLQSPLFFRGSQ